MSFPRGTCHNALHMAPRRRSGLRIGAARSLVLVMVFDLCSRLSHAVEAQLAYRSAGGLLR